VSFNAFSQQDSLTVPLTDTIAHFPGGRAAFVQYLKENLHYPQEAMDLGIQGKCYFTFTVEEDGSITEVKVTRGIPRCMQCDKEAVRLIKNMPKWKPTIENGKAVRSTFTSFLYFHIT
jgi:protein TonB